MNFKLICLLLLAVIAGYKQIPADRPAELAPGKFRYIDLNGEIVFNENFNVIADFSDGLARVGFRNKLVYINKNGDIIIDKNLTYGEDFSEGLAAIYTSEKGFDAKGIAYNKIAYIDKAGKSVIASGFRFARKFKDGLANVYLEEAG